MKHRKRKQENITVVQGRPVRDARFIFHVYTTCRQASYLRVVHAVIRQLYLFCFACTKAASPHMFNIPITVGPNVEYCISYRGCLSYNRFSCFRGEDSQFTCPMLKALLPVLIA